MLLVRIGENQVLLSGTRSIRMSSENVFTLFRIEDIPYFSVQVEDQFSLYKANDLQQALLNKIKILNSRFYIEHKIIWYSGNPRINTESIQLKAFDLTKSSKIPVNDYKIYTSSYNYLLKYQFQEGFAISNDQILFNPRNFDVKSSIVGKLEDYSIKLDKIVSNRDNNLLLSKFNYKTLKYDLEEISINSEKFKESYMSPDGRFLVLQEMNNTYYYYDIERNERINFVSGNFLDFRKDGNLIVEDKKRAIKIIDPITFQEVPSTNYHHYRFLSPDGKLYSQLSIKTRYYHKLNECEITKREFDILKFFIDIPKNLLNNIDLEKTKSRVERNRKELFEKFKPKCLALNIKSSQQINSEKLILVERFIEIGISGTNIVTEVPVPLDLEYYNHASFSFDNKYFSYVGKPTFNGLIHLYQLDFDESKSLLKIKKSYLTRLPRRASWVCGFSKTGYFATYDSIPDTYIIFVDDSLFESKLYEFDLRNKIKQNKSNFYHTYKNWSIIENKNFLSFSSSGRYLALSEQGYDPLTLNGHGHQESNIVHIANTENGEILNSFTGHGDKISYNRGKNVVFVSFSEDEKRIMTLSNDGVVFIRNIEIGDKFL
jgi:WD40 repeat protein